MCRFVLHMGIHITDLTKNYGQQRAVNGISINVHDGEIVGFLGPNGAGKSTTMKIITGFLPPTSGEVIVDRYNVRTHPFDVKKITGYLPEHNPLYPDLYVHEYLRFSGSLFGLHGRALRDRVGEMIELCGLTREQNKRIQDLSKGYKQRVGLAHALLHDPRVLILDEPTSGLDPNQILEIRKLIKDISLNKTVIFSTHIMQEVKALCDRVVVINRGQIVADDTLDNLLSTKKNSRTFILEFEKEIHPESLKAIPGVTEIVALNVRKFQVMSDTGSDLRPEIFRFAADRNLSLIGLTQEESSLENIFRDLTAQQ